MKISTSRRNHTIAIQTLEKNVFERFPLQTMKGSSLSDGIQTVLRTLEDVTIIAFLPLLFNRTAIHRASVIQVTCSRKKSLAA